MWLVVWGVVGLNEDVGCEVYCVVWYGVDGEVVVCGKIGGVFWRVVVV